MRATYDLVRLSDLSSLKCMHTEGATFSKRWHFHDEFELLFVEHSRGLRFVGSSVAPYREGDIVLLGPELPHVLLTNPGARPDSHMRGPPWYARSIVVQFGKNVGDALSQLPEFSHVGALLGRSRHGVHFAGPDARTAARHMLDLYHAAGAQRTLHLFVILDLLARSPRQTLLSKDDYVPKLNRAEAARINVACSHVQEHLTEELSQAKVAALVRMHPTAFSRFFRNKVGSTFPAYVNQLRVARALHLIMEDKMNISEAGFACGFNNLSTFNAAFRAIKGMSPSEFLRRFTPESDAA